MQGEAQKFLNQLWIAQLIQKFDPAAVFDEGLVVLSSLAMVHEKVDFFRPTYVPAVPWVFMDVPMNYRHVATLRGGPNSADTDYRLQRKREQRSQGKADSMKPLRFWLPMNGFEQEIIIPGQYVEQIMLPAAEHEAGHIIAAYHLKARVLGIAVGFLPERAKQAVFLQALYGWNENSAEASDLQSQCIVKAAGPAADFLFRGGFTEQDASGDLADIKALTGQAEFEPFFGKAKTILSGYAREFDCIARALRAAIDSDAELTMQLLPTKTVGALLLDEPQLLRCLSVGSVPSSSES